MAPDDGRIDVEKGAPDLLHKGEIALPLGAVETVEKDAADAPGLAPVGQIEVIVAPLMPSTA